MLLQDITNLTEFKLTNFKRKKSIKLFALQIES